MTPEQIALRALEVSAKLEGTVNAMNDTLRAHLSDCMEERRLAGKQRHDFRAETANNFAGLSEKLDDLHAQNAAQIADVNRRFDGRFHATTAGVVVLLLSLSGFLAARLLFP